MGLTTNMNIGTTNIPGNWWNGTIKNLMIWPTELTDAQMEKATQ
jgi:hypothetical protein